MNTGASKVPWARALLAIPLALGVLWFGTTAGSIIRGCVPIAPRELPSGAMPGYGIEGVTAGAKQVVWGTGIDRVEQVVGLTFWETAGFPDSPTLVRSVAVRGLPGTLYRMYPVPGEPDPWDLGFSWAEEGCDRTVFLAPGTSAAEAEEYVGRY